MDDDAMLTDEQVAKLLNVTVMRLRTWRWRGQGPVYHRFGRTPRYRYGDIIAFRDAARREPLAKAGRQS